MEPWADTALKAHFVNQGANGAAVSWCSGGLLCHGLSSAVSRGWSRPFSVPSQVTAHQNLGALVHQVDGSRGHSLRALWHPRSAAPPTRRSRGVSGKGHAPLNTNDRALLFFPVPSCSVISVGTELPCLKPQKEANGSRCKKPRTGLAE